MCQDSRAHITVKGIVQGIGYRWFVQKAGLSLNLAGWVRNLPDGSVETEAQGTKTAIESFLDTLRTGHSWARVDEINTEWLEPVKKGFSGFEIKF